MEYLKVAGKDQLFWNQTVLFLLNRWIRTNTADAKALSQIKVASLDLQTLHNYIPLYTSLGFHPKLLWICQFFFGPPGQFWSGLPWIPKLEPKSSRHWRKTASWAGAAWVLYKKLPQTRLTLVDPCWPLFVLVCPCLQSTCSTASCWTPGPVTMESCSDLAKKDLSTNVAMGHSWVPPNEMVYRNKLLRLELWLYHTDLWFPPSTSSKGGVQAGNLPAKNAGPGRCWDLSRCSFEAIVQFLFLCGADFPFG